MKLRKYCLVIFFLMQLGFLNCMSLNNSSEYDICEQTCIEELDVEVADLVDVMLEYFYKPDHGLIFINATIYEFIKSTDRLENNLGHQFNCIFTSFVFSHVRAEIKGYKQQMLQIIELFRNYKNECSTYIDVMNKLPMTSLAIDNLYKQMSDATDKILRGEKVEKV